MNTDTVKGFRDYTGDEAVKRSAIQSIVEEQFLKYSFEPAETPIIEYEEFVRGENTQDEAVSDIFKLQDKGKRNLALRYEFTFQLKRIAKNKKLPYKRYQIGPVFRDEPVSSNRFRQFTQCDADIIGSSIKEEAEILSIIKETFQSLQIPIEIYVGNRKLLNEIFEELKITKDREQILREIDKLDKISETEVKNNLKQYKAEKLLDIIKQPEKSLEKYKSYQDIKQLKETCKAYNVKFIFSPSLVRGLSYYNGTVFEIKTPNVKETLCAGGSYIANNVQATGMAIGIDRIVSLSNLKIKNSKTLIISINQDKQAIKLAQSLRQQGKPAIIFYGKISKALEYANSYNIPKVLILGEQEVKQNKIKERDMKTGKEILVDLKV